MRLASDDTPVFPDAWQSEAILSIAHSLCQVQARSNNLRRNSRLDDATLRQLQQWHRSSITILGPAVWENAKETTGTHTKVAGAIFRQYSY